MDFQRQYKRIVSLDIDLITYKQAIDKIVFLGEGKKSGYVCFANVHMVVEAHNDPNFSAKVNGATLVLADGMPLVHSFKLLFKLKQERIAGMDFMPDLIGEAKKKNLKIFFFGSTGKVLEAIKDQIAMKFPRADVVGYFSPPFGTPPNQEEYIDMINKSGAHLVFVALGCPKQETWMANNSRNINAILLGVGGAFPVFGGQAKRAPMLMRKLSLEWLYRLYQEPTRLFARYFSTNSKFILLILREKFGHSTTR